MSSLVQFAKLVEQRLASANHEPHWETGEAEQYMADVGARRIQFEQLATRLTAKLIQPRLEAVASCFPNASLSNDNRAGLCSCWFGYCERFPSSTKVTFTVEHDIRVEKVSLSYEAAMMPLFIKLNERDQLTIPLDEVDDEQVANWVEQRLLEFLDAYLRIDRGGADFGDETATDPVCGMRIARSTATASESYRGHPYFFCSRECQQAFAREPSAYVEVKTM